MAQDKYLCVPTHTLLLCVSTQRDQRVEGTRLAACVTDTEDRGVSVGCDPGTVVTLWMVNTRRHQQSATVDHSGWCTQKKRSHDACVSVQTPCTLRRYAIYKHVLRIYAKSTVCWVLCVAVRDASGDWRRTGVGLSPWRVMRRYAKKWEEGAEHFTRLLDRLRGTPTSHRPSTQPGFAGWTGHRPTGWPGGHCHGTRTWTRTPASFRRGSDGGQSDTG